MKWTCSLPLRLAGVISHVPPHAAVATFPAVSVPPNGSVSALVTPPRTQKLVFSGAYSSVENTLPAPYAASCAAESAYAGPARNVVDAMSSTAEHRPRLFRMVGPLLRALAYDVTSPHVLKTFQRRARRHDSRSCRENAQVVGALTETKGLYERTAIACSDPTSPRDRRGSVRRSRWKALGRLRYQEPMRNLHG